MAGIAQLKDKGYTPKLIAAKTGLTMQYVQGILTLLEHGEERLLVAVEKGLIPLNAALTIVGAGDDDKAIQAALQEAYETGQLRGKPLMEVRRIIERRQTLGRSMSRGTSRKRAETSTTALVRTYQREVERQQQIVKKAEMAQQRLIFLIGALRQLLADEDFVNLLRPTLTLSRHISDRHPSTMRVSERRIAKRLDTWIVDYRPGRPLRYGPCTYARANNGERMAAS
ncbi:MAG: hypothetical protein OHM77_13650 [Candidatus Nitricoxidivorans perseverans]|uniref:RepB plasmid partition domain-containing protein n=1 Tax=Candidatus Nitricoxidivorans perseverans TaxID=2975601 RepID=A0AA49FNC7_9PROT|nr:MAG: hypothetical protein OHM77_13650 [Candidatus Nitricoxidivorans perseverans]